MDTRNQNLQAFKQIEEGYKTVRKDTHEQRHKVSTRTPGEKEKKLTPKTSTRSRLLCSPQDNHQPIRMRRKDRIHRELLPILAQPLLIIRRRHTARHSTPIPTRNRPRPIRIIVLSMVIAVVVVMARTPRTRAVARRHRALSMPRRCNRVRKTRATLPASNKQRKPPKAKPSIARLPALIHTPPLHTLNPTPHNPLILRTHKVKKVPPNRMRTLNQQVIRAVQHRAIHTEAVKDERRAERLVR